MLLFIGKAGSGSSKAPNRRLLASQSAERAKKPRPGCRHRARRPCFSNGRKRRRTCSVTRASHSCKNEKPTPFAVAMNSELGRHSSGNKGETTATAIDVQSGTLSQVSAWDQVPARAKHRVQPSPANV